MNKPVLSGIAALVAITSFAAQNDENGVTPDYWYDFETAGTPFNNLGSEGLTWKDYGSDANYVSIDGGERTALTGAAPWSQEVNPDTDQWLVFTVARASSVTNAIIWQFGKCDKDGSFALVSLGSENPGVKFVRWNASTQHSEVIVTNIPNANLQFHRYAVKAVKDTSDTFTVELFVDGVSAGSAGSVSLGTSKLPIQFFGIGGGTYTDVVLAIGTDGAIDEWRFWKGDSYDGLISNLGKGVSVWPTDATIAEWRNYKLWYGANNSWDDTSNWSGGSVPATTDTVAFMPGRGEQTVNLGSTSSYREVSGVQLLDGAIVKFTRSSNWPGIATPTISGNGTARFSDIGLQAVNNALTIAENVTLESANNLWFQSGGTCTVNGTFVCTNGAATLDCYGPVVFSATSKLVGDGTLQISSRVDADNIHFCGDNTGFTGTVVNSGNKDYRIRNAVEDTGFPNGTFTLNNGSWIYFYNPPTNSTGETVAMEYGALNLNAGNGSGKVGFTGAGWILKVGAKNEDCTFADTFLAAPYVVDHAATIEKVGYGKLTFGSSVSMCSGSSIAVSADMTGATAREDYTLLEIPSGSSALQDYLGTPTISNNTASSGHWKLVAATDEESGAYTLTAKWCDNGFIVIIR